MIFLTCYCLTRRIEKALLSRVWHYPMNFAFWRMRQKEPLGDVWTTIESSTDHQLQSTVSPWQVLISCGRLKTAAMPREVDRSNQIPFGTTKSNKHDHMHVQPLVVPGTIRPSRCVETSTIDIYSRWKIKIKNKNRSAGKVWCR